MRDRETHAVDVGVPDRAHVVVPERLGRAVRAAQAEQRHRLVVDLLAEGAHADRGARQQAIHAHFVVLEALRVEAVADSGENVRWGGSHEARVGGRNSCAPGALNCRVARPRTRQTGRDHVARRRAAG